MYRCHDILLLYSKQSARWLLFTLLSLFVLHIPYTVCVCAWSICQRVTDTFADDVASRAVLNSLSKPIFLDRYECYSCFSSPITKTKTKTQIQNENIFVLNRMLVVHMWCEEWQQQQQQLELYRCNFLYSMFFFLLSFFNLFIFNLLYELCGCCAFVSWLVVWFARFSCWPVNIGVYCWYDKHHIKKNKWAFGYCKYFANTAEALLNLNNCHINYFFLYAALSYSYRMRKY